MIEEDIVREELAYLNRRRRKTNKFYSFFLKPKGGIHFPNVMKIIKAFQFMLMFLLFVLMIYIIILPVSSIPFVACTVVVTGIGIYIFIMTIHTTNQLLTGGVQVGDIWAFFFSLLGVILFGAFGTFLIIYIPIANYFWAVITSGLVSSIITLLFFSEVLLGLSMIQKGRATCEKCCIRHKQSFYLRRVNLNTIGDRGFYPSCDPEGKCSVTDLEHSDHELGHELGFKKSHEETNQSPRMDKDCPVPRQASTNKPFCPDTVRVSRKDQNIQCSNKMIEDECSPVTPNTRRQEISSPCLTKKTWGSKCAPEESREKTVEKLLKSSDVCDKSKSSRLKCSPLKYSPVCPLEDKSAKIDARKEESNKLLSLSKLKGKNESRQGIGGPSKQKQDPCIRGPSKLIRIDQKCPPMWYPPGTTLSDIEDNSIKTPLMKSKSPPKLINKTPTRLAGNRSFKTSCKTSYKSPCKTPPKSPFISKSKSKSLIVTDSTSEVQKDESKSRLKEKISKSSIWGGKKKALLGKGGCVPESPPRKTTSKSKFFDQCSTISVDRDTSKLRRGEEKCSPDGSPIQSARSRCGVGDKDGISIQKTTRKSRLKDKFSKSSRGMWKGRPLLGPGGCIPDSPPRKLTSKSKMGDNSSNIPIEKDKSRLQRGREGCSSDSSPHRSSRSKSRASDKVRQQNRLEECSPNDSPIKSARSKCGLTDKSLTSLQETKSKLKFGKGGCEPESPPQKPSPKSKITDSRSIESVNKNKSKSRLSDVDLVSSSKKENSRPQIPIECPTPRIVKLKSRFRNEGTAPNSLLSPKKNRSRSRLREEDKTPKSSPSIQRTRSQSRTESNKRSPSSTKKAKSKSPCSPQKVSTQCSTSSFQKSLTKVSSPAIPTRSQSLIQKDKSKSPYAQFSGASKSSIQSQSKSPCSPCRVSRKCSPPPLSSLRRARSRTRKARTPKDSASSLQRARSKSSCNVTSKCSKLSVQKAQSKSPYTQTPGGSTSSIKSRSKSPCSPCRVSQKCSPPPLPSLRRARSRTRKAEISKSSASSVQRIRSKSSCNLTPKCSKLSVRKAQSKSPYTQTPGGSTSSIKSRSKSPCSPCRVSQKCSPPPLPSLRKARSRTRKAEISKSSASSVQRIRSKSSCNLTPKCSKLSIQKAQSKSPYTQTPGGSTSSIKSRSKSPCSPCRVSQKCSPPPLPSLRRARSRTRKAEISKSSASSVQRIRSKSSCNLTPKCSKLSVRKAQSKSPYGQTSGGSTTSIKSRSKSPCSPCKVSQKCSSLSSRRARSTTRKPVTSKASASSVQRTRSKSSCAVTPKYSTSLIQRVRSKSSCVSTPKGSSLSIDKARSTSQSTKDECSPEGLSSFRRIKSKSSISDVSPTRKVRKKKSKSSMASKVSSSSIQRAKSKTRFAEESCSPDSSPTFRRSRSKTPISDRSIRPAQKKKSKTSCTVTPKSSTSSIQKTENKCMPDSSSSFRRSRSKTPASYRSSSPQTRQTIPTPKSLCTITPKCSTVSIGKMKSKSSRANIECSTSPLHKASAHTPGELEKFSTTSILKIQSKSSMTEVTKFSVSVTTTKGTNKTEEYPTSSIQNTELKSEANKCSASGSPLFQKCAPRCTYQCSQPETDKFSTDTDKTSPSDRTNDSSDRRKKSPQSRGTPRSRFGSPTQLYRVQVQETIPNLEDLSPLSDLCKRKDLSRSMFIGDHTIDIKQDMIDQQYEKSIISTETLAKHLIQKITDEKYKKYVQHPESEKFSPPRNLKQELLQTPELFGRSELLHNEISPVQQHWNYPFDPSIVINTNIGNSESDFEPDTTKSTLSSPDKIESADSSRSSELEDTENFLESKEQRGAKRAVFGNFKRIIHTLASPLIDTERRCIFDECRRWSLEPVIEEVEEPQVQSERYKTGKKNFDRLSEPEFLSGSVQKGCKRQDQIYTDITMTRRTVAFDSRRLFRSTTEQLNKFDKNYSATNDSNSSGEGYKQAISFKQKKSRKSSKPSDLLRKEIKIKEKYAKRKIDPEQKSPNDIIHKKKQLNVLDLKSHKESMRSRSSLKKDFNKCSTSVQSEELDEFPPLKRLSKPKKISRKNKIDPIVMPYPPEIEEILKRTGLIDDVFGNYSPSLMEQFHSPKENKNDIKEVQQPPARRFYRYYADNEGRIYCSDCASWNITEMTEIENYLEMTLTCDTCKSCLPEMTVDDKDNENTSDKEKN